MKMLIRLPLYVVLLLLTAFQIRAAVPSVSIKALVERTTEGGVNPGVLVVERSGATSSSLSVNLRSVDGLVPFPTDSSGKPTVPAARNGVDYKRVADAVTIPAGTNQVRILIQAMTDTTEEGWEHATVRVSSSSRYSIQGAGFASVFIENGRPTPPNKPPVVKLTAPASGILIRSNSFNLTAEASDPDGKIDRVEFLNGETVIGTDKEAPYSFVWKDLVTGNYQVRARAVDNSGDKTTSTAVRLTVLTPNLPPVVRLTSPTNGAVFLVGATINLKAEASDRDGRVLILRYRVNGKIVQESSSTTYSWKDVQAGEYSLSVDAIDNSGAVASSEVVKVVVRRANQPPKVAIVPPSTNPAESIVRSGSYSVRAEASDPDGKILKVEFLVDGKVFATSTQPSTLQSSNGAGLHQGVWKEVSNGYHTFTARAWDDSGESALSAPVKTYLVVHNEGPVGQVEVAPNIQGFYFRTQGDDIIVTTNAPARVAFRVTASSVSREVVRAVVYLNNKPVATLERPVKPSSVVYVEGLDYGTYSMSLWLEDSAGLGVMAGSNKRLIIQAPAPVSFGREIALTLDSRPDFGPLVQGRINASIGAQSGLEIKSVDLILDEKPVSRFEGGGVAVVRQFKFEAVPLGAHYLSARMTLSDGTLFYSKPVLVVVLPQTGLSIVLTAPRDGAVFQAGSRIELALSWKPEASKLQSVKFFATDEKGSIKAIPGSSASSTTAVWTPDLAGTYRLHAEATSADGLKAVSESVKITVQSRTTGTPPKVDIVSPRSGTVFAQGSVIEIKVQAADADGYVPKMEILDGERVIDSESRQFLVKPKNGELAEFVFQIKTLSAGKHELRARATDDSGRSTISGVIVVEVRPQTDRTMVTVEAAQPTIPESAGKPGTYFKIIRNGDVKSALVVGITLTGTAKNGTDYTELASKVTFPPGESSVAVNVVPIADRVTEGSETVILTLLSPSGVVADYVVGTPSTAKIEIVENNVVVPPVQNLVSVFSDQTFLNVASGETASFTFVRTGTLTEALTVNYQVTGSAEAGTDYEKLPGTVVIPAGQTKAVVTLKPRSKTLLRNPSTVILTVLRPACIEIFPQPLSCYDLGAESRASIVLVQNLLLLGDVSGVAAGSGTNLVLVGGGIVFQSGAFSNAQGNVVLNVGTNQFAFGTADLPKPTMQIPAGLVAASNKSASSGGSTPVLLEGISAGMFGEQELVLFPGTPFWSYVVEYSEDGGNEWHFLTNAGPVNGIFGIADIRPDVFSKRHYRARMVAF